jgi:glutaredoxin
MNKINYVIYGTLNCGYCIRAKELLESQNVEYTYVDINEISQDNKEALMEIAGQRFETVPQIFQRTNEGLSYVGGYTHLEIRINGL